MKWLREIYTRRIPRMFWEQRYTLLVIVCVFVVASLAGYDTGRQATTEETWNAFERISAPEWYDNILPNAPGGLGTLTWLGLFTRNALVSLLGFAVGVITLGFLPVGVAGALGHKIGLIVGMMTGYARQAAGLGPWGTAAGLLLPHAPLELPAIWLSHALGLRAGLVWIRPLRGRRRLASIRRLLGDYGVALFAIIPAVLVAALLEAYVEPKLMDRYVFGIGAYPAMSEERRVSDTCLAGDSAWSRDGKQLALLAPLGGSISVMSMEGDGRPTVLLREDEGELSVPSWSPGGDRLVVARHFIDYERTNESGLMIVDVATGNVQRVQGGPVGNYYGAAWSPDGQSIAAVVFDRLAHRDHGRNLWRLDLHSGEWTQITDFTPLVGVALLRQVAWSPDGEEIAFIRQTPRDKGEEENRALRTGDYLCDLCAVTRDGSRVREITRLGPYSAIAWSPTGDWIAFHAGAPWTDPLADLEKPASESILLEDLGLVRPDGSERIDELTRANVYSSLSWSPDGSRLLYHRLAVCIIGSPRVLQEHYRYEGTRA